MPDTTQSNQVIDNTAASRFELRKGDDVAIAEYIRSGDTITFTHTAVPSHIQERGVASTIARFALDQARAQGLSVVPRCKFIAGFIEKHPEYADLVNKSA